MPETIAPPLIEGILHFPEGLPGFENLQYFVLIQDPDLLPIVFLSAVAEPRINLPVTPVRRLEPNYRLEIGEDDRRILELTEEPQLGVNLLCLAVVNLGDGDVVPTANLFAPLVINIHNRKARQVLQTESAYSVAVEIR